MTSGAHEHQPGRDCVLDRADLSDLGNIKRAAIMGQRAHLSSGGMMRVTAEKAIVLLGRVIEAAGSLVFLKMLSSMAGKADVGQYMLASSFLTVLLTMSFSALDQGLLRNIADYKATGTLGQHYGAMLPAYLGLSILLFSLSATMLVSLNIGTPLHSLLLPLSLWVSADALKNLNATIASGLRLRWLIIASSLADYASRIFLIWAIYRWATVTTTNILFALAASGAAASIAILWGQRRLVSRFSRSDVYKTLSDSLRFSWPMIIWGLFGWLQNMSNRWLLNHFTDLGAVAEYGVLVAIASFPVSALLGLVGTYVIPILYERESNSPGAARQVVTRVALNMIPPCALLVLSSMLWHTELVTLLSDAGYAQRSQILPMFVASACLNAICSVLTYAVYAQRRVISLLAANTIPGLFSLAFGYVAVSRHGFEGAALSLILSHLLAGCLFVLAFVRAGRNLPPA